MEIKLWCWQRCDCCRWWPSRPNFQPVEDQPAPILKEQESLVEYYSWSYVRYCGWTSTHNRKLEQDSYDSIRLKRKLNRQNKFNWDAAWHEGKSPTSIFILRSPCVAFIRGVQRSQGETTAGLDGHELPTATGTSYGYWVNVHVHVS